MRKCISNTIFEMRTTCLGYVYEMGCSSSGLSRDQLVALWLVCWCIDRKPAQGVLQYIVLDAGGDTRAMIGGLRFYMIFSNYYLLMRFITVLINCDFRKVYFVCRVLIIKIEIVSFTKNYFREFLLGVNSCF